MIILCFTVEISIAHICNVFVTKNLGLVLPTSTQIAEKSAGSSSVVIRVNSDLRRMFFIDMKNIS